ncbi:RIIa domain-containing protein 1-like [Watersipora subatra]|uniref:RIIa domain-containing protein 1-like n=1 Tax=Watersipora subatra TaxID=2589382 RepID=UPI00355AEB4C
MADQPKADPPHGLERYDLGGPNDLGALSKTQQEKLNRHKIQTRMANEKYLREHPEVDCLLSSFLRDVYLQRPEDIREFAATYFNDVNLPDKIEEAMTEKQEKHYELKVLRNINHNQTSS